MRKLSVAFLLCLISFIANAQAVQHSKPIICDEAQKILSALKENYQEYPIWIGSGEGVRFSLFVNAITGSWTLLQFNAEVACVLGVGKDSELLLGEKT